MKIDPKKHVAICHFCERRMWCSSLFEKHEFWTTLKLIGWRWRGCVTACPDHAHALSGTPVTIRLPAVGPKRAMRGGV